MAKGNTGNSAAAGKAAAEKAAAEKAAAEKAAAEATKQGKSAKVPALSVTSSRDGFRRAGRVWSKEAQIVKLSELSKEQIKQIRGEAMLTVAEVEVAEPVAAE